MNISERIAALRSTMADHKLDAYIIPSTDPHMSEYVPLRWTAREWISGFTGSAGTVVITQKEAGLWTDSRYFIQAQKQIEGSGIQLMKMGLSQTPGIAPWLIQQLDKEASIGFDGACMSMTMAKNLKHDLSGINAHLIGEFDLIESLWIDRPEIPRAQMFAHQEKYAGKSRLQKLEMIRQQMNLTGTNHHFMGSLDDIAWTFNIRGNDVSYNPVVVAYALITNEKATLYIQESKVPTEFIDKLALDNIQIADYYQIFSDLKHLPASTSVLLDPLRTNDKIFNNISANIVERENPSQLMKSIKNKIEIEGTKRAMTKDGIALTQFCYWLENTLGKEKITEITIMEKLRDFRAQQKDFMGESFGSIVAYGPHAASPHYSSTPESDVELQEKGLLLIDSGGQYIHGTTDITRTFTLGPLTQEEKTDFTLVLKGTIQLSMAKFPHGTRGCNLDILARQALWQNGRNYGHGTGHGVGCFLNVHEGPQSIRQEIKEQAILPGMITSNEPGLYREGKHGIRHENMILCKEAEKTQFGEFLCFETLTLCPFDTRGIIADLLDNNEKQWLNNYHRWVFDTIAPHLDAKHKIWLQNKTKAL